MTSTQPHILIITLSNIGDAILTTPVLAALHAQLPEARIDLVSDVRSSALFDPCPYVDRIFLRDKRSGWAGYVKLIRLLRKTRYDVLVDLRTDFLPYLLRAKQVFKKRSNASTMHLHSAEKHLAAVQTLVGDLRPKATLWASAQDHALVADLFPMLGQGRWLAIGPGANFAGKVWPVERYAAVANALAAEVSGVVLLGSQGDTALAQRFGVLAQLPVLVACGRLTLPQSYALLQKCEAYLGNDSGLGHMAAAAGLATLTLFGPGSPVRYLPWSQRAYFIQDAQQDILGIRVETVVARLQALLAEAAGTAQVNPHPSPHSIKVVSRL